jgi:UDP-N-acetyl-D-glucosamine dehydrogenase
MKVCVVGLGKIGLPLSVQFAKSGFDVAGVDISENSVSLINNGIAPFPGEPWLDIYLKEVLAKKKLLATSSYQQGVTDADVVVVLVPLIVDEKNIPNYTSIDSATTEIAKYLKKGALVSYETTLPIGTTRNRFGDLLEKISGLKVGMDFHLVFSPERVSSGRIFEDLKNYPKIVGGVTATCTEKGVNFYSSALTFNVRTDLKRANGVWAVGSSESSEFVKLAETTYRDVNIGLANQFAIHAKELSLDINEIIESANSQPFSHIHTPGISVGGHCIPVYPHFYLTTDPNASIVKTAREQNAAMPNYYLEKIRSLSKSLKDLNILILGVAYRPDVKEHTLSGTLKLAEIINAEGGNAVVVDPLYTEEEIKSHGLKPFENETNIDYIILHTGHSEFKDFDFLRFPGLKAIIDGRHFFHSISDNPRIIH